MFASLPEIHLLPLPEIPPPALLLLSLSTAAWIAALTAAVCLRLLRTKPQKSALGPTDESPCIPPPVTPIHVAGAPPGSPSKSRFTVTYSYEEEVEEEECDVAEVEWEVTRSHDSEWMEMMRGDLGWYRHQDRAAIDGSVVRLWGFNGGLTAVGLCSRGCKGRKGILKERINIESFMGSSQFVN